MGSSFIHGVLHHHQDGPAQEHPYLELLRGLLRAYLPRQVRGMPAGPQHLAHSACLLTHALLLCRCMSGRTHLVRL